MMRFPPPPTQVEPIDLEAQPNRFNPQWLKWFTDMGNRDLYYGAFYSLETQSIALANAATEAEFEEVQVKVNVNIPDQASKIRFTQGGLYRVLVNARVKNGTAAVQSVWLWLRQNGVDVSASAVKAGLVASDTDYVMLHMTLPVRAGDYLEVLWTATSALVQLEAVEASADIPAVPSIIFETSQMDLWDIYKRL